MDKNEDILKGVKEILSSEVGAHRKLIPILQAMQKKFGYLPKEGMVEAAKHLGISPANVFGVATFYNQFRYTPPGKHHIKVCMGTACHIKQGGLVLDQWERKLEIEEGGVTPNREYSLERVACIGCCTMAPVSTVGEEIIGEMSPTKVDGILLQHQIKKEQKEREAQKKAEKQGE